jgi:flagellar motor switch protein FliM
VERSASLGRAYETFLLPPLPGRGSVRVDSGLAEAAIEALFGGAPRARSRAAQATITPIGHRVASRLIAIALRALPAAWQDLYPVEAARPEAHARNSVAPSGHARDALAVVELAVEIGHGRGALLLALPRDMLEPAGASLAAVPPDDEAVRAHARLLAHLARAQVEVTVEIPLRLPESPHALALRAGDVITLDPAAPALARVNGVPLAQCRYGTLHGHNAVAVERMLGTGTGRPAREDASEA